MCKRKMGAFRTVFAALAVLSVYACTLSGMDISNYNNREYRIYVGDPYGFRGPTDIEYIQVTPINIVHGPDAPNWQKADVLFRLV